ncbi:MAG: hypothetical protein P4K94_10105 [Terracidiphilus sp.]|nr:hypothetical protein [Terracidiphilus sp.]
MRSIGIRAIVTGLLSLCIVATLPAHAASPNDITGRYAVLQTTESGSQVTLSLRFHLINRSTESVTLSNLVFLPTRSVSTTLEKGTRRNAQQIASSLVLETQTPAELTSKIVISKDEYLHSQHPSSLRFRATIQNADGTTQTQTLALHSDPFTAVKP